MIICLWNGHFDNILALKSKNGHWMVGQLKRGLINCKFYKWLDSSMNVCSNTYTPNGHFMTLYTYTKQRVFHIDLLISQSASCENNWSKGFINIELAQYVSAMAARS